MKTGRGRGKGRAWPGRSAKQLQKLLVIFSSYQQRSRPAQSLAFFETCAPLGKILRSLFCCSGSWYCCFCSFVCWPATIGDLLWVLVLEITILSDRQRLAVRRRRLRRLNDDIEASASSHPSGRLWRWRSPTSCTCRSQRIVHLWNVKKYGDFWRWPHRRGGNNIRPRTSSTSCAQPTDADQIFWQNHFKCHFRNILSYSRYIGILWSENANVRRV